MASAFDPVLLEEYYTSPYSPPLTTASEEDEDNRRGIWTILAVNHAPTQTESSSLKTRGEIDWAPRSLTTYPKKQGVGRRSVVQTELAGDGCCNFVSKGLEIGAEEARLVRLAGAWALHAPKNTKLPLTLERN